jgi:hypothetical protein
LAQSNGAVRFSVPIGPLVGVTISAPWIEPRFGNSGVTLPGLESCCAFCSRPARVTVDPPRRTLARGLDPTDPSYSVTILLPDVLLCLEHALDVRQGNTIVGWCDDPLCRAYGEVGQISACGNQYKKLGPSNRSQSSPSKAPTTKQEKRE